MTEWVVGPDGTSTRRDELVRKEAVKEEIAAQFRAKGGDALNELDAIEDNANVPSEVTAYLQHVFAMQYLTYVSLTGDRIPSVEDRFFGQ